MLRSSVSVVERVIQIANSTLDSQPHYEQAAQEAAAAEVAAAAAAGAAAAEATAGGQQPQRAGRLVSMPSMATLCNKFDGVRQFVSKDAGQCCARFEQGLMPCSSACACDIVAASPAQLSPMLTRLQAWGARSSARLPRPWRSRLASSSSTSGKPLAQRLLCPTWGLCLQEWRM